jgi:hypothetical protein
MFFCQPNKMAEIVRDADIHKGRPGTMASETAHFLIRAGLPI